MKIALLGTYPIRPFADKLGVRNPPRNTTSWNVNLARGLVSIPGNEVHFVTVSSSIPKDQILISNGVILHFLSVPPKARLLTLFQYNKVKIHRELKRIHPDIVHGHGTEHEYPYIAATFGCPFTITIHCVLSDILKNGNLEFGKQMRFRFLQCLEQMTLRRTHCVIVTTEYMIRIYSQRFPGKRWFVVNNSIDPLFFAAKPVEKMKNYFLYVGRISPEKGILTLLKAFKIVVKKAGGQANLCFLGAIEDKGYYKRVKKFIAENGLEDRVIYEGLKSQEEVARMMASSISVVLPSRYDAFGLVLAEAMAAGTPVIATKVGGIPYVVRDGKTGLLVESGDVDGLAERMLLLLEDENLRRKIGQWGKNEAWQRFRPEVAARKTMDVYQKVLEEGGYFCG